MSFFNDSLKQLLRDLLVSFAKQIISFKFSLRFLLYPKELYINRTLRGEYRG